MRSDVDSVDAYIDEAPEARRDSLQRIRALIDEAAPGAEELMRYGHPHWLHHGSLFALASQKHHLSLYVAEKEIMAAFRARFGRIPGVQAATSCIRFRTLDQLPTDDVKALLAQAVAARDSAVSTSARS